MRRRYVNASKPRDVVMLTDVAQVEKFYDADGCEYFVHSRDKCAGTKCALHDPSDHKMRTWPRVMRESTLIERRCEHGVGHPDPDSAKFLGEGYSVHGCDGCCR